MANGECRMSNDKSGAATVAGGSDSGRKNGWLLAGLQIYRIAGLLICVFAGLSIYQFQPTCAAEPRHEADFSIVICHLSFSKPDAHHNEAPIGGIVAAETFEHVTGRKEGPTSDDADLGIVFVLQNQVKLLTEG